MYLHQQWTRDCTPYLEKSVPSGGALLLPLLKQTTHHLTVLTFTQWMSVGAVFLHGGIQWFTFASPALACQKLFCENVTLLPAVTQQQKHNRILLGRFKLYCHITSIHLWCCGPKGQIIRGGITFRAAFVETIRLGCMGINNLKTVNYSVSTFSLMYEKHFKKIKLNTKFLF